LPEPERILRMRTVIERTGLSRSTLYRKMRDGTFPNQVRISEHCCGWRESAINRWIADPVAHTENKTAETVRGSIGRSLFARFILVDLRHCHSLQKSHFLTKYYTGLK
jgi:prophage regulatory protein